MKWLALQGLKGGVGTTTVATHLAVACHLQGRPTFLLDFSPGNLARVYLGMPWEVRRGLLSVLKNGQPWYQAAYRSPQGVPFIPFGQDSAMLQRYQSGETLRSLFRSVRDEAGGLDLPDNALCFVDCPPLAPSEAMLLAGLADLNLLVLNPDPGCYAVLKQQQVEPDTHVLVNRLRPEIDLSRDIHDLLLADAHLRVLPVAIQEDACIAESLAWKQTVFEAAPASQAAHDLGLLASWVASSLREVADVD